MNHDAVTPRHSTPRAQEQKKNSQSSTAGDKASLIDVVFKWILTSGNYQRWRQERKTRITKEILAAAASEIGNYDAGDVRRTIEEIENRYMSATKWLAKNRVHADAVIHGDLDKKTMMNVLEMCPRFCELAPVLREFNFVDKMESKTTIFPSATEGANVVDDISSNEDGKWVGRKRHKEINQKEDIRSGKRRCEARASLAEVLKIHESMDESNEDTSSVPTRSTYKSVFSSRFSAITDLVLSRTEPVQHAHRDPDLQRKLEEYKFGYEVKTMEGCLEMEEKKRECEVEIQQHRAEAEKLRTEKELWLVESLKNQVDFERRRGEVELRRTELSLRVDGALSRRALEEKGVSGRVVDDLIP